MIVFLREYLDRMAKHVVAASALKNVPTGPSPNHSTRVFPAFDSFSADLTIAQAAAVRAHDLHRRRWLGGWIVHWMPIRFDVMGAGYRFSEIPAMRVFLSSMLDDESSRRDHILAP
jgi:hypothetical protein